MRNASGTLAFTGDEAQSRRLDREKYLPRAEAAVQSSGNDALIQNCVIDSGRAICVMRSFRTYHTNCVVWRHVLENKLKAHDACENARHHRGLGTPLAEAATRSACPGFDKVAADTHPTLLYLNLRALSTKRCPPIHHDRLHAIASTRNLNFRLENGLPLR